MECDRLSGGMHAVRKSSGSATVAHPAADHVAADNAVHVMKHLFLSTILFLWGRSVLQAYGSGVLIVPARPAVAGFS